MGPRRSTSTGSRHRCRKKCSVRFCARFRGSVGRASAPGIRRRIRLLFSDQLRATLETRVARALLAGRSTARPDTRRRRRRDLCRNQRGAFRSAETSRSCSSGGSVRGGDDRDLTTKASTSVRLFTSRADTGLLSRRLGSPRSCRTRGAGPRLGRGLLARDALGGPLRAREAALACADIRPTARRARPRNGCSVSTSKARRRYINY